MIARVAQCQRCWHWKPETRMAAQASGPPILCLECEARQKPAQHSTITTPGRAEP
jgi:hypothetical protein